MTMIIDVRGEEWVRRQIKEYKNRYEYYRLYADVLERIFKHVVKKLAPLSIVQTRPKSIASFAEKCQRKKTKYKEPVNQLTDLCGVRIIVQTADKVKAISRFIEKNFLIDWENTIDVSQRLKPSEFGYRSVHYIISFKPEVFPSREVNLDVPSILFDDKKFPNRRAEIQVRTILEHAWADMAHDLALKSSFQIPEKWEREFAGVAAMLEGADQAFSRIQEGLKIYATSYGAYMTDNQIREEIKLLDIVLDHDPQNLELAGRIAKLAMTRGDWQKTFEVLSRYVDSENSSVLRDLGIALCKMHKNKPQSNQYKQGQQYLEKACEPPNEDVDALASLAGTWKGVDEEKVRGLYRRAFELDPTDPYPLENYLDSEIAIARNLSILALLNPTISLAIQKCLDQAEVGVNLPWAFYMIGKFYLLLDKPYDSIEAYAKAIQLSPAPWMIETALVSLERLKDVANDISGYEWVRRLLLIGRAAITGQKTNNAVDKLKLLASIHEKPIHQPVVILVGDCNPFIEQQMTSCRQLVIDAFRGYEGIVIGGGTREGISGLVGDLGEAYRETIRTIGYLPKLIPADTETDPRYQEFRKTNGSDFSPLEPIQAWIDIIASEVDPTKVKILGMGGGKIAGVEYRIALALGATVGIVEKSGREVATLLRDEKWMSSENLVIFPADAMTVRAFIGSGGPALEAGIRAMLAREIHEEYRLTMQHKLKSDDSAMADWEKLAEELKESNAQQADHIFEKLFRIGCDVQKVSDREIKFISFTKDEIELLAEIEHGRWNAERLLRGWTWGEKKDVSKKKSPYLISWAELPEEIKELDRATVRQIPKFLSKAGLEIQRKS